MSSQITPIPTNNSNSIGASTNYPPNPNTNPSPSNEHVNVDLDINLDALISAMTSGLNNNVNSIVSTFNKIDSKVNQNLSTAINQMNSSVNAYYNKVDKELDNQIKTLKNTLDSSISNIIRPITEKTNKLAEEQIKEDIKSRLTIEGSLKDFRDKLSKDNEKLTKTIETSLNDAIEKLNKRNEDFAETLPKNIADKLNPLSIDLFNDNHRGKKRDEQREKPVLEEIMDIINYFFSRGNDIAQAIEQLGEGKYKSLDELKNDIFGNGVSGDLAENIFTFISLLPIFKELFNGLLAKTFTELHFLAMKEARPNRPSLNELYGFYAKGLTKLDEFLDAGKELGYEDETLRNYFRLFQQVPTLADLFELSRRGELTKEDMLTEIQAMGYSLGWAEELSKLIYFQPPVQDVIRFRIRDVYDTELAELSGIFEGWDNAEYLEDASKAGLKPEDAKKYWGAHWFLPSATQGFEMFQRERINREELEALLKAADFAPNWRQKLLDIAYYLPTKVDVRRAYEDGHIEDDKLKEYIRHSGVDPSWHEIIFNWYKDRKIRLSVKKDTTKTLSISQIIKAYLNGTIQQSEAVQRLNKIGYTLEDAILLINAYEQNDLLKNKEEFTTKLRIQMREMGIQGFRQRTLSRHTAKDLIQQSGISSDLASAMLDLTNQQYEIDRKVEFVSAIRKLYIGYDISENKLYDTMKQNGFSHEEIEDHIKDLKPLRELRYKELTRADIKKGIDNPELGIEWGINKLKGLGYSDKTIEDIMIIEDWKGLQNSLSS